MAIAGNRSPSPTTNSRPNLISRNSELNSSPMRKSNPFQRPLRNGPQDSSSRNYLTKEEKENDTDHHILKQAKIRSPSVSKATNHFMIPTISAASKFNPSPRKKVLGDRNEPTRTSLSFSEDKSPFSLLDCDKKPAKAALETPLNPNSSPKVSNITPLDADPSLPPYDPKTNFLSPRPQFLHYRPNPRLEHYYQEQGNGIKNLEDSFLYESSSSDNEVSEGSAVDSSRRESEDSSSAEGIIEQSQKEADDVSSMEVVYTRNEKPITTPIKDNEFNDKSELNQPQNEVEDVSFVEIVNENFRIENKDSSSVEVVNSKADVEVLETEPISTSISQISELSEGDKLDVSLVEVKTENITRESMDTSLVDIVSKDDGSKFSEPEPIMNPHICEKTTSKEKGEVKSRLFSRGKFIPLLLFLLFICFFVSSIDSPIYDVPVNKFLRSSKFYEERFNGFAREIKTWSDYSTSYVSELISSFTKVENLGPIQFLNLTYKQDDPFIGMKRVDEISVQDEVENVFEKQDELEHLLDENLEDGNQNIKNEHDFDIVCDLLNGDDFEEKLWAEFLELSPKEPVSEVVEEDHVYELKTVEEDSDIESSTTIPSFESILEFNLEKVASDVVEEYHVLDSEISEIMRSEGGHRVSDSETVSIFENTLEEGGSLVDPEYNYEKTENVEIMDDCQFITDSEIKPIKVESVIENTLQMNDSSDILPDYKSSNLHKTLAISLLILALIAPILIYLKNKNRNIHNSKVHLDPVSKNKKMKSDTGTQSCSPESEISSSFDGSYSYSKGYTWGITNEAHSKERKQRRVSKRESLASSSGFSVSDSPSYGSFTTYERLSKQGFGDDEVVTPVRRSSRIKKIQVASP